MNNHPSRMTRLATACGAAAALTVFPVLAPGGFALSVPVSSAAPVSTDFAGPASPGDGTAAGAIEWFHAHKGETSYEGYCEMAVENAWGTTGVWPSAKAHWEGAIAAGKAHKDDKNPPKGAFVYWNTSQYGHVGIADGEGGFYSSSVNGALGHGSSLSYFGNYLGWSDPQVPG